MSQSAVISKQINLWSPNTDSIIQDCFATAPQHDSSINIQDYAEHVNKKVKESTGETTASLRTPPTPNTGLSHFCTSCQRAGLQG